MPLAQATTGVPDGATAASVVRDARAAPAPAPPAGWRRARAASREVARSPRCRRRAARRAGAGFRACLAIAATAFRHRAPTASRRGRRARRHWRARCPRRRAPSTAMRSKAHGSASRHRRCCGRSKQARGLRRLGHLVERPARARRGVERVGEAERQPLGAGPGDHRAVVGAERRRRRDQHGAGFEARRAAAPCGSPGWRRRRRRRPARSARRSARGTAAGRRAAGRRPTSTTACWNEAQRSATSWSRERRDLLGFEPQRGLQAGQREIRLRAGRASAAAARSAPDCRAAPPSRPAARRDSRGRAAWRSCRRPRRWRRRWWCRAARSRRRRAPRRSGCGRRRRGTGNRETACRRSAARSAHAPRDG